MASKSKKSTRKAQARSAEFAESAVESGQKIWLAGLGAYERAKQEGPKMFEVLVARGRALRGQAREAADQALKTMRAQADATAAQAAGKWDKLEQVFEDRVSKSLNRLGVLSGKDVDVLARQVAELNDSVRALMGGRTAPARSGTKKRAASKKKKRSVKKAKAAKAAK